MLTLDRGFSSRLMAALRLRIRLHQNEMLALLAYAVLVVPMTWPVARRLGSQIPFSGGDAYIHIWTFRWIRDSLLSGHNPYYTDLLYFPDGVSLYFHNIAWVNIALWLPLQFIIGETAAYSVVFIAIFAFNGFATYLLARHLTHSRVAAFIAGLIVAFWPYTLAHHNHPNIIFIGWIPLALLFLIRFLENRRIADAVLAAICIALLGITRWQLLVIGAFVIGPYLLYRLLANWTAYRRLVPGLVGIGLLALLLMAPLLFPVVNAQLSRQDPESLFVEEEAAQADLLGYLLPNRYHPLWGPAAARLYDGFDSANQVLSHTVGYSVIILVGLALLSKRRSTWVWLVLAALIFVLALGPNLLVGGRATTVPLPYKLLEDFFLIKLIRNPDRLNVILSIPVAVLAAYGIVALETGSRTAKRYSVLAALFAGLILAEYIVSYPTRALETPKWYTAVAREPGRFGILGLPMQPRSIPDKAYMVYQFVHNKPIVGGHVSRPPASTFDFINGFSMLAVFPAGYITPGESIDLKGQFDRLAQANVRYLVLHKEFFSDEVLGRWEDFLYVQPTYEDNQVVVYDTSRTDGLSLDPANRLADGFGLLEADYSPKATSQDGWATVEIRWMAEQPLIGPVQLCLDLTGSSGESARTECRPLSDKTTWQAGEIRRERYLIHMDPYLPADRYRLKARLAGVPDARPAVDLGQIDFSAVPRTFVDETELDPERVDATWEGDIALADYELSRADPDRLQLDVRWLARQRPSASLSVFLHLRDKQTGELVAQVDGVPRAWSYPTHWWEAGEVIDDSMSLSLEDVSPGQYELWLGWYDVSTLERSPVEPGGRLAASEEGDAVRLDVLTLP